MRLNPLLPLSCATLRKGDMRTRVVLLSIAMLSAATLASAGEVRVYDAEGQYLGIQMDYTQPRGETSANAGHSIDGRCTIFMPSIGKYTSIESGMVYSSKLYPNQYYPFYKRTAGDIFDDTPTRKWYEGDCDGTPYYDRCFDEKDRIYRIGDKYVLGSGVPIEVTCTHYYVIDYLTECCDLLGGCYELSTPETYYLFRPGDEVSKEQIPFNLPVAIPLRFEYMEGPQLAVISFSINKGATSTTSRQVTLNNKCTGDPFRYMASESPSFAGAVWKAYSTVPGFTLSAGKGTKTVYFKVKNSEGESLTVVDSILKQ
jgi:hypothetical protein